jgi:DNA-binding transcriptional ArsR family regulator
MGIVIKSKDKNVIKKISEEILEKYAESIESLYISFERTSPDLAKSLLALPDHQRKTFEAMLKLREATAEQVASETKRARAIESAYLNQLVQMGYLEKKKKGRIAYFSVSEKYKGLKLG